MLKIIIFLIILCSCSTLKTEQELLSQSYRESDYIKAHSILNSQSFKKDQNKLLFFMEKSTTNYHQKRYLEALDELDKAQNLADRLYTKSIKKLILSGLLGDEAKDFYGKIYERSALYHLEVIIFFKLYSGQKFQKKETLGLKETYVESEIPINKRRNYLLKARSVVLKWNSFYDELKRSSPDNYFSYDYNQQILSALIHEEVGTRSDLNISLILYENTLKDFDKFVALYPKFNQNYDASLESYLNRRGKTSIVLTDYARKLKDFILFKELSLTKRIKKNKLKSKIKKLKPSKEILSKINLNTSDITFIYSSGFVDSMKEKIISYNLAWALDKIEDDNTRKLVEVIGISALTYFTLGTLGASTYVHSEYSHRRRYVHSNLSLGNSLIKNIGIDLKIPYQREHNLVENISLYSGADELGDFSILESYSDRSYVSTKQYASRYYDSIGPKIALKYLAAIVAAYSSYKALKRNENPFASTLALTQYLVSSKAISASQSVDSRNWVGLPSAGYFLNIHYTDKLKEKLSLKIGENKLKIPESVSTKSLFFL